LRHYEQVFILKPTLTPEELASKIENIKESITKNGGEIVAFQDVGMKQLAYEIDKNKRGYYGVIFFKIDPSVILELERLLRISEDVLKFLTVKYDSKKLVKEFQKMVDKANGKAVPEDEVKKQPVERAETESVATETEENRSETAETEKSSEAGEETPKPE
jgi:small subunit ribosomal protein S6